MEQSWAVVTGASGGLGEAYAKELARQGANVALAARKTEELERVAAGLQRDHGVATRTFTVDLAHREQRATLLEELSGMDIHTLVNNAGRGTVGELTELEPSRVSDEVELNVMALTELSHAVLPRMKQRGRGALVNVASTAAFQPVPMMTTYAATKSYVLTFTVGIWAELKGTDVRAVAVCPGPTETNFFAAANAPDVMSRRRTPDDVIRSTFKALRAGRPYVVDGFWNNALAQVSRVAPMSVSALVARQVATH